jgi:beta-phosphoglucomutase-like phosphatase (HAD superfamily)
MITPIELVIFDCDGILIDSEPIAVRAYVALDDLFQGVGNVRHRRGCP